MASRTHPQQAYRSCLGLLGLGRRYPAARLEAVCRRALPAGIRSYKGVRHILEAHLDRVEPDEPAAAPLTSHANLRGDGYYH